MNRTCNRLLQKERLSQQYKNMQTKYLKDWSYFGNAFVP